MRKLNDLLERLPDDLARQAVTHASWVERRSESYERLAFLGDSVLGLAVTTHLWPRLQADTHGAGRLTKIRAQAVSGRSCREVAARGVREDVLGRTHQRLAEAGALRSAPEPSAAAATLPDQP